MSAPSKPTTTAAAMDAFIKSEADTAEAHRRLREMLGIEPDAKVPTPEPSVDFEHMGIRIRVRHLRHADGTLFAFDYSITDPEWGEIQSYACYECGETFDEFVESCRRIAEAVILNPHDWLDDDYFDDCGSCDGSGSVRDIKGDRAPCGHCEGKGRILLGRKS